MMGELHRLLTKFPTGLNQSFRETARVPVADRDPDALMSVAVTSLKTDRRAARLRKPLCVKRRKERAS